MTEPRQLQAFLDVIAACEIGPGLLRESNNGYDVLVGSTPAKPLLFMGYEDHPNIYNARMHSTAAGRYQILYRFWVHYKKLLQLPDFSPASQDKYALHILDEQRATTKILAGDLRGALARCANIWASLPGAPYGQPTKSLAFCREAFARAGGLEICEKPQ